MGWLFYFIYILDGKHHYNNLGGLSFAQGSDGNWGYKIGGADTVTPFSNVTIINVIFNTQTTSLIYIPINGVSNLYTTGIQIVKDNGSFMLQDINEFVCKKSGTMYFLGTCAPSGGNVADAKLYLFVNGTQIEITKSYGKFSTQMQVNKGDIIKIGFKGGGYAIGGAGALIL